MLTDDTLARNLRSLSHPRRVMLFRLLIRDPNAGDSLETLIQASGLRKSSAVHHLREMERCGLVIRQRRGIHQAYRLAPGELTKALARTMRMSEAARRHPARAA